MPYSIIGPWTHIWNPPSRDVFNGIVPPFLYPRVDSFGPPHLTADRDESFVPGIDTSGHRALSSMLQHVVVDWCTSHVMTVVPPRWCWCWRTKDSFLFKVGCMQLIHVKDRVSRMENYFCKIILLLQYHYRDLGRKIVVVAVGAIIQKWGRKVRGHRRPLNLRRIRR